VAAWSEFEADAPALAAEGRRLVYARGNGEALLVTVRGDDLPRVHPVNVGVVHGGLYVFLLPSAKRTDLERDGRYALHTHQDPAAPDEFSVRGRAQLVPGGDRRSRVAQGWFFEVDDGYWLFELEVQTAILGRRTADEWPPRYTRWSAAPE